MTRKLEELFDLPPKHDSEPEESIIPEEISPSTLAAIDKIEAALPEVKGLGASDQEMDDLAKLAVDSYKDLMDLGMNVDSRFAAEVLGVASNMLGHAITAKTAKINKKLRMIDLQLKKMNLDQRASASSNQPIAPIGEGHVVDRNELLQQILAAKPKDSKKE